MPRKTTDFARAQDKEHGKRPRETSAQPGAIAVAGKATIPHRAPMYVKDKETRAAWTELCQLAPEGLWTKSDSPALLELATIHARVREGTPIPAELQAKHLQLLNALGLTPAGRQKIKVAPPAAADNRPANPFEALRVVK